MLMVTVNADARKLEATATANKDYEIRYTDGTLKVTWPVGTTIKAKDLSGVLHPAIEGYKGSVSAGVWGAANEIVSYVTLPAGDFTLKFPAGDFTVNNVPVAEFSETFSVGGSHGGGQQFQGESFHETIFKSDETVPAIPFVVDNNNVNITTVGVPFMNTTLDVEYNMYNTKELNWKNGTKFVFTAKKDINKVIFIPTDNSKKAITRASAEGGNGTYTNGVWEGKLAAGEKLTLTANDGINIKEIYVCYNGDTFTPINSGDDDKGMITVQWPVENQSITKITDGGILAKFTTNKKYAQVTLELRNTNSNYHNLYDLPMRYMDNLEPGQHTCTTSTPGTSTTGGNPAWIPFNGDAYELVIKAYNNFWDNDHDAMVVVPVRGESAKEHETLSSATLVKITPSTATETNMGAQKAMVTNLRDNTIRFEFSDKLSKFDAVRGGSLMAGISALKLATAATDGNAKVWTVTIPQSDLANYFVGEDYNFEITAYDANGHILNLNEGRADHALAVIFEITDQEISENDKISLGTPAFSIEDGADNVPASTKSILVTFPEAKGFGDNVIAKVSGALTCRDQSAPVVFSNIEGTLANGVSVPVEFANDKSYSFSITSISLAEKTIVDNKEVLKPINTYNGSWEIIFYVHEKQGGDTGDNILGEVSITANAKHITVAWPAAQLTNIKGCAVSFGQWTLTHKNKEYYINPELTYDIKNGLTVEIPYSKIAAWDDTIGEWGAFVPVKLSAGDEITISIPADEGVCVWENYDEWGPMVYSNPEVISGSVTIPAVAGINSIAAGSANENMYNVAGQQIKIVKGIVIKNGKKMLMK